MIIERKMSNKVDDKWLKNLRECMEDYAEPLPEGLWDELESELAQPKTIPFWRRWPAVAAAVALVLLVSSLSLSEWFSPVMDSPEMQVANQLAEEQFAGQTNILESNSAPEMNVLSMQKTIDKGISTTKTIPAIKSYSNQSLLDEVLETNETQKVLGKVDESMVDQKETDMPETENTQHTDITSNPHYNSAERTRTLTGSDYPSYHMSKRNVNNFELGLHTGGMPYGSSKGFTGMSRLAAHRTMDMKNQSLSGNASGKVTPYDQVLFSNRDKRTHTDVKHRMPVNVVASVKWYFAENWALESGISYTYMQSELHSGSNLYWEDTQKLHYVGIPIKLHRNLWSNSLFSFYASAGGMLEKCIKGSLESVYVTSNSTKEVENHTIQSHPFQWSVAAAVGAQANLIRNLSLFVEPGVAYYFDDNSAIETIRKEHPFNFNLQFGLRLNISR